MKRMRLELELEQAYADGFLRARHVPTRPPDLITDDYTQVSLFPFIPTLPHLNILLSPCESVRSQYVL